MSTFVTVLIIIAGVLAIWGARTLSLFLWPYSKCLWCRGKGRNLGSNSDRWGNCFRCGGAGKKLRRGAKARP